MKTIVFVNENGDFFGEAVICKELQDPMIPTNKIICKHHKDDTIHVNYKNKIYQKIKYPTYPKDIAHYVAEWIVVDTVEAAMHNIFYRH